MPTHGVHVWAPVHIRRGCLPYKAHIQKSIYAMYRTSRYVEKEEANLSEIFMDLEEAR